MGLNVIDSMQELCYILLCRAKKLNSRPRLLGGHDQSWQLAFCDYRVSSPRLFPCIACCAIFLQVRKECKAVYVSSRVRLSLISGPYKGVLADYLRICRSFCLVKLITLRRSACACEKQIRTFVFTRQVWVSKIVGLKTLWSFPIASALPIHSSFIWMDKIVIYSRRLLRYPHCFMRSACILQQCPKVFSCITLIHSE